MALILHRRDDPTALADQLAQLLAEAPLDVFARELVVAPSAGVERWLTQRLSHRLGATLGDDGVCAGLDVRTPSPSYGRQVLVCKRRSIAARTAGGRSSCSSLSLEDETLGERCVDGELHAMLCGVPVCVRGEARIAVRRSS